MRGPVRLSCEFPSEAVARILWLRRRLLSWFEQSGRFFPWREPGRTPYEFVEHYPSWAALAQAPLDSLENALRSLGLWRQKALAFQHLAQSIEERDGVLPRTELERLPGIGPYTASAVLATVYGRPEPLLDVNMARLLGRFLGPLERAEASPRRPLHVLALRLVRSKRSFAVNWAALDFGALMCKARRPRCPECPLRNRCEYGRSR
jgi:A/G-specific adenine glycosylase